MLQLENHTPFAAAFTVFPNPQGKDTLYVIVKASFELQEGRLNLADEQLPPQETDEFWGEPEDTSLKAASDFLPVKPATDIIVTGSACGPDGRTMRRMEVSAAVGDIRQSIMVFGNRVWREGHISEPEGFTEMPIIYENAFGGCCESSTGEIEFEARNPVGKGFWVNNNVPDGTALPNLELPSALISEPKSRPLPVGFGPIAPGWQPRASLAGTYDDVWSTTRAPFLPLDYNVGFANVAHPSLVNRGFLLGGEPIIVSGMSHAGAFNSVVPAVNLSCQVSLKDSSELVKFNLETLIIEPAGSKLQVVWKSEFGCNRASEKIRSMTVKMSK